MSNPFDLSGHVALARELVAEHGGKVVAVRCDVASEAEIEAAFAETPWSSAVKGGSLVGFAVYLASAASEYRTGDAFLIDGGYRAF